MFHSISAAAFATELGRVRRTDVDVLRIPQRSTDRMTDDQFRLQLTSGTEPQRPKSIKAFDSMAN